MVRDAISNTIKEQIVSIMTANDGGNQHCLAEKDKEIESILGIKYFEIEQHAKEKNIDKSLEHLYLDGINSLALNTSWFDIYQLFKAIEKKDKVITICDLGAGYCRLSIIAQLFFPNIKVISIEPVSERMERAKEICDGSHHEFYDDFFENISHKIKYDFVFLYFPNGDIFENILEVLKKSSFNFSILCIESHGEMISRLSFERSWLKGSPLLKLKIPRHSPELWQYETTKKPMSSLETKFYELYKHDGEILIRDNFGTWCASRSDCYFYFQSSENIILEFKYPPRTYSLTTQTMNSILINKEDLSHLRDKLELRNTGRVRKVYLNGNMELPNGKIVKEIK